MRSFAYSLRDGAPPSPTPQPRRGRSLAVPQLAPVECDSPYNQAVDRYEQKKIFRGNIQLENLAVKSGSSS
jgi:hypothetical protein